MLTVSQGPGDADLWVINTCTVKSPSQAAMSTLLKAARERGRPVVVAGCVPQGDRSSPPGWSASACWASPRSTESIVEAVEETLKGNTLSEPAGQEEGPAGAGPAQSAEAQRARRDRAALHRLPGRLHVSAAPSCFLRYDVTQAASADPTRPNTPLPRSYCKTKHARGQLGGYEPSVLVARVVAACRDPLVREVWLSSEDTGAYGRDLGTDLPSLLTQLVAVLPPDGRTMLCIDMINPPYILQHLPSIAAMLRHPSVYAYLHVPVQSGSDAVLAAMKREYSMVQFQEVADKLAEVVPGLELAMDIIAGFPGKRGRQAGTAQAGRQDDDGGGSVNYAHMQQTDTARTPTRLAWSPGPCPPQFFS